MARFWNDGICMELEDLLLLKVTQDARIPSKNTFSKNQPMLYPVHGIWNIGESHLSEALGHKTCYTCI